MADRTLGEQLTKYLADVHSIEVQALAQLKAAPGIAHDDGLAAAFREHEAETREHERLVREQLEERGADPSTLKDLAGRVGGWAMIAFAKLNPDTPGKLVAHAYAYEHMELAAYELLSRVAERAGEGPVVAMAARIAAQERAMAQRLAGGFDRAVQASFADKDAEGLDAELVSYLRDARAIESQAEQLLQASHGIAGSEELAEALLDHLAETREHQSLIEERLRAHDSGPARVQDGALRIGGLTIGAFFAAQPDTPVKLAGFAFAFEHLEIAGYELLRRVADRADDAATVAVADLILDQERDAAERVASAWDSAVDAALDEVGVRVPR
jgi:ferritin-like metal-binding protein YciE